MAEINTRKRGKTWEYRFELASVAGKRKQKSKGGFRTKSEAIAAGVQAYAEYCAVGKIFTPSELSYADVLDQWLAEYCSFNYEITTQANYEKIVRLHIKPTLGEYRISTIDTVDFQRLINDKFYAGYSLNRLSNIKNVLSGSVKYAKRMGYIKRNPVLEVELPSRKAAERNKNTRHKERQVIPKAIIAKILERFPEGTPCHIPLILGYKAGLRIAECFALTWDDFNYEKGTLRINKQIQMNESSKMWTFKPPKYGSARIIPLDEDTIALLHREKIRQKETRLLYGSMYKLLYVDENDQLGESGTVIDMMMRREDGSYIQSRCMQHYSRTIRGRNSEPAICEYFDYHSLRHTHATELADSGATAKEIQVRLGHKRVETTLNTYTHETEHTNNSTREILNRMYI